MMKSRPGLSMSRVASLLTARQGFRSLVGRRKGHVMYYVLSSGTVLCCFFLFISIEMNPGAVCSNLSCLPSQSHSTADRPLALTEIRSQIRIFYSPHSFFEVGACFLCENDCSLYKNKVPRIPRPPSLTGLPVS